MSSFEDSSPISSSSSGRKKAEDWQTRIKETQLSRATPELISRMRESAERQRRADVARLQSENLCRVNFIQMSSNARTLTDFSSARGKATTSNVKEVSDEYSSIREVSAARSLAIDRACRSIVEPVESEANSTRRPMKTVKAKKVFVGKTTSLVSAIHREEESSGDEFNEDERELRKVEADLGINYNAVVSSDVHEETNRVASIVTNHLREVAIEPTDPAEAAAKFTLFENASQTVTTIREQTLKFWTENKASFPGKSGEECLRDIAKIDSQNAMGIEDNPRVWFILSMIKKCNENSTAINDLLAKFRARLELLLQEPGDCPFCLDPMTLESACALGCCHRVCSDCWDNWVELKGANAFCPLCRHTEFMEELAAP